MLRKTSITALSEEMKQLAVEVSDICYYTDCIIYVKAIVQKMVIEYKTFFNIENSHNNFCCFEAK